MVRSVYKNVRVSGIAAVSNRWLSTEDSAKTLNLQTVLILKNS